MKNLILAAAVLATAPAHAQGTLFSREIYVEPGQFARRTPPPANPAAMEADLDSWVMQTSNQQRARAGLPPLAHDPVLADAAARYSRKMRDQRFFDHVSPQGETLGQRLPEQAGWRYVKLGENLWSAEGALDWQAHLIAEEAAANWIESPSHRDNLLEPAYTLGGVGTAIEGERVYITMLYARPHDNPEQAALLRDYNEAPADLGSLARSMQQEIADAMNRERLRSGLPALRSDPALTQVARTHAEAMLRGGFFSETGLDGRSVLEQAADPTRMATLAVDLWRGSGGLAWRPDAITREVLGTWRQDADNWRDVVDPSFDLTGVGVATDGSQVLVTALFAESSGPTTFMQPATGSTITVQ